MHIVLHVRTLCYMCGLCNAHCITCAICEGHMCVTCAICAVHIVLHVRFVRVTCVTCVTFAVHIVLHVLHSLIKMLFEFLKCDYPSQR